MDTLERTYELIKSGIIGQFGEASPVEPFEHVENVESLRHRYKPTRDLRLLLIAESHVRTADSEYATKGMQFIYEHRYYTPWWHDLILPGFGASGEATTASLRRACLLRMQEAGFWLLDASVIALSGYKNVGAAASRPFEARRDSILTMSWSGHVRALLQEALAQPTPPVVVAFDNVAAMLPSPWRDRVARLKFKGQSNTGQYRSPDYRWGTANFAAAAREAGLHDCLRGIGS